MGDPQYLVRIRSEALADLDREYAYSKRQWGVEHARSYFATLRARIANLAKHPMQSPGIGGRNSEWRCLQSIGGLRVAYRVDSTAKVVEVFAIVGRNRFHAMEDLIRARRSPTKHR